MTEQNKMTLAEFEERLPEFFATGTGKISDDPRLEAFLIENPDSATLVSDLQYIAQAAKELLNYELEVEPSEEVWKGIALELNAPSEDAAPDPNVSKAAD